MRVRVLNTQISGILENLKVFRGWDARSHRHQTDIKFPVFGVQTWHGVSSDESFARHRDM